MLLLVFVSLSSQFAFSQEINPDFLTKNWNARWITAAESKPAEYGVYVFRKGFDLSAKPDKYVIHVSADNKYRLYVNGEFIGVGPARNDIEHWFFDTYDIAPYLKSGKNTIAAKVWNEGAGKAEAQISLRTGFIVDGEGDASAIATNDSWKARKDEAYAPIQVRVYGYYAAGPGENIQMENYIKDWQSPDLNDEAWPAAQASFPGVPKSKVGAFGAPMGWMLIPSGIPTFEFSPEKKPTIRRTEGVSVALETFGNSPIQVPANSKASILLDQTYLTNAYPTFTFAKGKDATVKITYAEALYGEERSKGNRNEIAGKTMVGRFDQIVTDGSEKQRFTPLNYRTYRYIQLEVETKDEPLTLQGMEATFTGFPFELKAEFGSDDPQLQKILEIGWRTARLCAVDSYLDCPYYEQLQYIGDGRIQMMISYYNTGDDRLAKNSINQISYSQQPEGVTFSRYPSASPQYIPPFSMWYVGMLHDYLMYGSDLEFLKTKLNSSRSVIQYFQSVQGDDGSLGTLPFWSFVDWATGPEWGPGIPPMGADGNSAILDLQMVLTLQYAADLEKHLGIPELGANYLQEAEKLKATIRRKYWDAGKGLFADRSEKDVFSQHANALAILSGLVEGESARAVGDKMLALENNMVEATIYFKYYIHQALVDVGKGDEYLTYLDVWRKAIDMGLTTWAETSDLDKTRSDSHAWGSSPNIEFYRTILGIDSDGPGFRRVKIEPHLGEFTELSGKMPHPNGEIEVSYDLGPAKSATVHLPKGVVGSLVFQGTLYPLQEGTNRISLN
ncbi:alpha-L-rhamnosidase N-terminal domain-containing protein [Algoriphagus sp. H41]|uniref:Alpha-L-rhamnosidase N-terminal domain-containing protein n=1 Tax=Algoriphagus oliviformis TaxID=2811231 RepID=A0ABS3C4T7_9BACT|nr:alpha-L-rhamnosidase N-terminal domain-containing protein [Algoriphagus oliviformis]MBN7811860.1 alpha-L-rhamnosidase N-terminal domain-containing protein [Algoriphagus oliviformis]